MLHASHSFLLCSPLDRAVLLGCALAQQLLVESCHQAHSASYSVKHGSPWNLDPLRSSLSTHRPDCDPAVTGTWLDLSLSKKALEMAEASDLTVRASACNGWGKGPHLSLSLVSGSPDTCGRASSTPVLTVLMYNVHSLDLV
jgi:hypothetical protein